MPSNICAKCNTQKSGKTTPIVYSQDGYIYLGTDDIHICNRCFWTKQSFYLIGGTLLLFASCWLFAGFRSDITGYFVLIWLNFPLGGLFLLFKGLFYGDLTRNKIAFEAMKANPRKKNMIYVLQNKKGEVIDRTSTSKRLSAKITGETDRERVDGQVRTLLWKHFPLLQNHPTCTRILTKMIFFLLVLSFLGMILIFLILLQYL